MPDVCASDGYREDQLKYLVLLLALVLTGCGKSLETEAETKARGEARLSVFRECMELAAKMPRQSDDDVSDIVLKCQTASYYLTEHVTEQKATK